MVAERERESEREGRSGEEPRVRPEIASSLTAINCQNVPHNSARANEQPRPHLPSSCESEVGT